MEGGGAVFFGAGVETGEQLFLTGGEGGRGLGEDFVRGDMKRLTDAQNGFQTHVYAAALDVRIGTVGQSGGFGDLHLGHAKLFSNGQQVVSNYAKIRNEHFSSSFFLSIGIIIPKRLDK